MFENPRRGRQARNFTTNVPKILDIKSSSEQIFSENCSRVLLIIWRLVFRSSGNRYAWSEIKGSILSLITCPSGINLFEIPDQYIFDKLILLPEKTT